MRPLPLHSRREVLGLGLGGALALHLGGLRRLGAQEATRAGGAMGAPAQQVVLLYMAGGMSQLDTFDPKPGTKQAGPLKAIRSAAKGLELAETLPRLAEQARHLALLRGMLTREGAHDRARYLLHTGYPPSGTVRHPDLGAQVVSAHPDPELDIPAYVTINGRSPGPGFLGIDAGPFVVGDPRQPVANLVYPPGVDAARFDRRRRLLEAIEKRFRKQHPGSETDGHQRVYERADRLMHSPRTKAFDLTQEPAAVRQAYGEGPFGQGCLLARRLLQAGVRVVEVVLDGWDTHQDNFTAVRRLAGELDQGFAALLRDLHEREQLAKTLVVCLSEFGRTPAINKDDGRDHHANGWTVALAGGPVRGGRVVGATSPDGEQVAERPVSAPDLMATLFAALGIDPSEERTTPEGRPIRAVEPSGKPVSELFA